MHLFFLKLSIGLFFWSMWKELEFLFTHSHKDQKSIEDNSIGKTGLLPSKPPITSEVEDFGGTHAGKLL